MRSVPDITQTRFVHRDGAVYLGLARLTPDMVRGLRAIFQREGAWRLFDQLAAAVADINEPELYA